MKGNDVHSGHAPFVNSSTTFEEWASNQPFPWDISGLENRAVYVCYIQKAALCRHRSSVFHARNTLFGNACDPIVSPQADSTITEAPNFAIDGDTILGDSHQERLSREIAMLAWNQSIQAGLNVKIGGLSHTISHTFPIPPHPLLEREDAQHLKGRYQYFRNIIKDYSIVLTKKELKIVILHRQNSLQAAATAGHDVAHSFPENRRPPIGPTRIGEARSKVTVGTGE